MKKIKAKSNTVKKSFQSKTFKETYFILDNTYFILDNKFKVLEGSDRKAESLSISDAKGDSKHFSLTFSKSTTKKLQSLISQVIINKKYQQTESKIKIANQSLLCTIDIIPKGNSALILIKDISKKKDILDKLKKSKKQLRDLANHLMNIREEERLYFTREIHDDLGQKLTALQIEVGLLLKKIRNTNYQINSNRLHTKLQSVNKLINDTLNSKKNTALQDQIGLP